VSLRTFSVPVAWAQIAPVPIILTPRADEPARLVQPELLDWDARVRRFNKGQGK
jgi:hypothetical protein